MKPTRIFEVLDLAQEARNSGRIFNPLFTGEAGLGKSAVIQQWVKKQRESNPEFGFIDLRIAYMEAPDLIGFPEVSDEGGVRKTCHRLPEFWPTQGSGLLLLEEPNRGTTGVMNCLMQLLTDRKVHNYTLPPGWMVAGAINPDSAEYDVHQMDFALRDRFEEFEITYDHNTFVDFVEAQNWDHMMLAFIKSSAWVYKPAREIKDGGKYISPRTWSKLNAAELAGARKEKNFHDIVVRSILGKDIGKAYWSFCHQQQPVSAEDLLKGAEAALEKLKAYSDPSEYRGDIIATTVDSVIKAYGGLKADCKEDQIDEDLMAAVAKVIPSDQALNMIKLCGQKVNKGGIGAFFKDFCSRHPELVDVLRDNIVVSRVTDKKVADKKK